MKNNKGFSLIELMVVVAIIGILSAIAIPNFQRFQRKAKQSEAKGALAGIFEAEKAFMAEWNNYYSGIDIVGYRPEGRFIYNAGFLAGGVLSGSAAALAAATAVLPGNPVGYSGPVGNGVADIAGACALANANCIAPPVAAPALAAVAPAGGQGILGTFVASAGSSMLGGAVVNDIWTINQSKALINTTDGL